VDSPKLESLPGLFPLVKQWNSGCISSQGGEQNVLLEPAIFPLGPSVNPIGGPSAATTVEPPWSEGDLGRGGTLTASMSQGVGHCVGQDLSACEDQLLSESEVALFSSVQDLRRSVGLREVERGDCTLSSVLDSLVPTLQEIPKPKPLPTFRGKMALSHVLSTDTLASEVIGSREGQPCFSC
jgi:hypothetical protein